MDLRRTDVGQHGQQTGLLSGTALEGIEAFDRLDLAFRIARHRAESERAAGYRILSLAGLPALDAVACRLEARCRARERFLRRLLATEETKRVRALLNAYVVGRGYGTLLVRFACNGRGFIRVFEESPSLSWGSADVLRVRNVAVELCDFQTLPSELKTALWKAGEFQKRLETSMTLLVGREVAALAGLPPDAMPFQWRSTGGPPADANVGVCCYVPKTPPTNFVGELVVDVRLRRLRVDGPGSPRYLPRMTEESLSFVDERVEPRWAVEALRLGMAMLATRGRGRAA